MKKIFLLVIMLLLTSQSWFTRWLYEKELPSKFKKECFEYSSSYNFLKQDEAKYKIEINKSWTVAVKDWYLIPIIPYKITGNNFNYTTDIFPTVSYFNDNNESTYNELDTDKNTEILIAFDKLLQRNSFWLNFKHNAYEYAPELFISEDGVSFSPVSFRSLYDFDIKFLKIVFAKKTESAKREKIKITELSFLQEKNISIMRVSDWWRIDFYNSYACEDYINLDTINVPFEIDINTPTIKIELKENVDYNPNIDIDADADGIDDFNDNCIDTFNPLQKDQDADWKWDRCSDIDGDWIVWSEDNCPSISNPDQKDINLNNTGDVCEFDKDSDWIFDSVDNCITTPNQLQNDIDNDWIGNLCDNCDSFNPKQLDSDNNKIWDVCDERERIFAENDDDIDGIANGQDNCPLVVNAWQEDSDNDWVGDLCDNCKEIQNTKQYDFNKNSVGDICEDSDWDWITWMEDNCMNVANIDQKDTDNDGIGDVCEDDDNDRIWFAADNCPTVYNPQQKDVDKDGIWNACDEDDNRLLESNKWFFTFIVTILIIIFCFAIFMMIKKVNNNDSAGWFKKKTIGKKNKKMKSVKKPIKKKKEVTWSELFESYTERKRNENWE